MIYMPSIIINTVNLHSLESARGFLILLTWGGTFVHSVQMLIPSKQSVYFYYFG